MAEQTAAERATREVIEAASSWADLARTLGCSRSWARDLGRRRGVAPGGAPILDAGPSVRSTRKTIRLHESGAALMEELAADQGLTWAEWARPILELAAREQAVARSQR